MNHKSSKTERRIEAEVSSSESLDLLYFNHRNIYPKPPNSSDFRTSHYGRRLSHSHHRDMEVVLGLD